MFTELYFVNDPLLLQVFEKISESDCENAKVILRRIQKREFYKSIAEIHPQKGKITGQAFKTRGKNTILFQYQFIFWRFRKLSFYNGRPKHRKRS